MQLSSDILANDFRQTTFVGRMNVLIVGLNLKLSTMWYAYVQVKMCVENMIFSVNPCSQDPE